MIEHPIIAGIIAFIVTLTFAAFRGDRFVVNDPRIFGGKRDIIPGTMGIFSGFAIALLFDQPARTAAIQYSIFGAILAAIVILIFKKFVS